MQFKNIAHKKKEKKIVFYASIYSLNQIKWGSLDKFKRNILTLKPNALKNGEK